MFKVLSALYHNLFKDNIPLKINYMSYQHKLNISNITIKKYKSSELYELEIIKPNEQRIIDKKKVDNIIKYQLGYLQKYNHTNFLGVINIHYCNEDSNYYLVDGQHRYDAINILWRKYSHNIYFFVELVTVDTREQLKENYKLVWFPHNL